MQLGPLVVGTVAGMSVWSILYASLGGASKALLESGESLDVLLAGEGGLFRAIGLWGCTWQQSVHWRGVCLEQ